MSKRVDLEIRRAEVAVLARKKHTTREIASMTGATQSSVQQDIKWLRKEWAKDRGDFNAMLEDNLHTLGSLQREAFTEVENLAGTEKLSAIQTALKVIDQINKLANLYSRPGAADGETLPEGQIGLTLTIIPSGNRNLIDAGNEDIIDLDYPAGSSNSVGSH